MNAKENLLRAIRHDNPEWIPNGMETQIYLIPSIIERPPKEGPDAWGVIYAYEPRAEGGTYPLAGGFPIKDFENWREEIKVPSVKDADWTKFAFTWEEEPHYVDLESIDRSEHIVTAASGFGLFERSWLLLGMENAFVYYMTEPDEMKAMVKVIADYKIEKIRKMSEVIKPDIIWYGDDWGNQRQTFLPPRIWRDIIMPETKRIYDCIHELGIIINQHSCGHIQDIFGDMVEMGVDIWNPCQPCNDLKELKKKYGSKITFCGGLDSQFVLNRPGATPEETRAEVRKKIDMLREGGGYIAAPSHDVPYAKEIVDAMNDEISKYGRYR
jgi:hypothetical protein